MSKTALRLQKKVATVLRNFLNYINRSVRRKLLDEVFSNNLNIAGPVLDIGGKRTRRRSTFYDDNLEAIYINPDRNTSPDFCCQVPPLPPLNKNPRTILLAETIQYLELKEVEVLLAECAKIADASTSLIITFPYMHPNAFDFSHDKIRPSALRVIEIANFAGWRQKKIFRQGGILAICLDACRWYVNKIKNPFFGTMLKTCLVLLGSFDKNSLLDSETNDDDTEYKYILNKPTTGYCIEFCKKA